MLMVTIVETPLAAMRLAGRPRLHAFWSDHPDARGHLEAWAAEIRQAAWRTPHELTAAFPKARIIGHGRVIFAIRGNRFRLDALVDYRNSQVLVVRVGTHADYDKWTF